MDNYKLAFIYGKTDQERGIIEGNIEKYGVINDENFHITCLLDFIKEKGFKNPIFSNLNKKHPPELVSYLISNMGHIVFLNTTKKTQKYGKTGMFMIPNNISIETLDSLYLFADALADYSVMVFYDMHLADGILEGNELQNSNLGISPRKLLEVYFSNKEKIQETSKIKKQ